MAAALQRGPSAFEPRQSYAKRVRGSRSKASALPCNGPGRCGMWGLRAPARCSTVPSGTNAASRGSRLKLTVVRRNRAGHLRLCDRCDVSFSLRPKRTPLACARVAPFIGPGLDQLPLEFRQPTKHSQHQPPMRRGGVRPGIRVRVEPRAFLRDRSEHVQQIPRATRQPIQPSDQQNIASAQRSDRFREGLPIGHGATDLLSKHLLSPRLRSAMHAEHQASAGWDKSRQGTLAAVRSAMLV
jgi:hypothetical protein